MINKFPNESYYMLIWQIIPEIKTDVIEATTLDDLQKHVEQANKKLPDTRSLRHYAVVHRIGDSLIPIKNFPRYVGLQGLISDVL